MNYNGTIDKTGDAINPKNAKHGDRSIMLWGCFCDNGTSKLVCVRGTTKKEDYRLIREENKKDSARSLIGGRTFYSQHDNDPNMYTSISIINWIKDNKVNVLEGQQ